MRIKIISKILPVVAVILLLSVTTYGGDDIRSKKLINKQLVK